MDDSTTPTTHIEGEVFAVTTYEDFSQISNLEIGVSKTKAAFNGTYSQYQYSVLINQGLTIDNIAHSLKFLGSHIDLSSLDTKEQTSNIAVMLETKLDKFTNLFNRL